MGIMPKGLASRPEMHDLGGQLMQAFNVLSSSRQYGMNGPLPITISDIAAYCQLFAITVTDERADFLATMQRLDGAYLASVAKANDKGTVSAVVATSAAPDNPPKG